MRNVIYLYIEFDTVLTNFIIYLYVISIFISIILFRFIEDAKAIRINTNDNMIYKDLLLLRISFCI